MFFCKENDWTGSLTSRIPQPMPNCSNPGHFLFVFETPLTDEDSNQPQLPDDWQPRVQISKAFDEGNLALDDQSLIDAFAKKIRIGDELVAECLRHCQKLQTLANI